MAGIGRDRERVTQSHAITFISDAIAAFRGKKYIFSRVVLNFCPRRYKTLLQSSATDYIIFALNWSSSVLMVDFFLKGWYFPACFK